MTNMGSSEGNAQEQSPPIGSRLEDNERLLPSNESIIMPAFSCGLTTGIVTGAMVAGLFYYIRSTLFPIRAAHDVSSNAPSGAVTPSHFPFLPHQENVCFSKACLTMSRLFRMFVDEYTDPCNDFYEYVCGRYEVYDEDFVDVVEKQLEVSVWDMVDSISVPPVGQSAVQKAVGLVRACYDVRRRKLQDPTELLDFMKSHNIVVSLTDRSDPLDRVFILSFYYDVNIFFTARLSAAGLNSKKKRLIILDDNPEHLQWLESKAAQSSQWRREYRARHLSLLGIADPTVFDAAIERIETRAQVLLTRISGWSGTMVDMTVPQMQTPYIPASRWLRLLQTYAQPDYTLEDTVQFNTQARHYLDLMTTSSPQDLNLLVAWEVVRQLGVFAHVDIAQKLGSTYYKVCRSRVGGVIDFYGAYFLRTFPAWTLSVARNLTLAVRNELLTAATMATLLPNKDQVLAEIADLNVVVGLPEAFDTTEKLDAFWKGFPDVKDRFLRVWLNVRKTYVLRLLDHPDDYVFPTLTTRVHYVDDRSLLVVPASLLSQYFFGADSLASLNFAGLGHLVGAGLMRAIQAKIRSKCLELVGLEAAYSAYVKGTARDTARLPEVDVASSKLFFVAACLKMCSTTGTAGDSCNMLVRNMKEFGKLYGCAEGSKMNPTVKCTPW